MMALDMEKVLTGALRTGFTPNFSGRSMILD